MFCSGSRNSYSTLIVNRALANIELELEIDSL